MTETDLVAPDEAALRKRRYDYEPEQVRLIKATVAEGATDAELAMFLELAARYGLDPFAREIWCVKSGRQDGGAGRILIMVGRDGLRKLAKRAHARVDQDVVREQDSFSVRRTPDGRREVEHSYNGSQSKRGEIVGAWCEVETAESYGFFYAPLEEYLPTSENKLKWSPWGSQRSVMILAAAERQALRMAIPLSGVLVEGEMDLAQERAQGAGEASVEIGWPSPAWERELAPLFGAINAQAPHSYGGGAIDLLVRGQGDEALTALRERLERELSALSAAQDGEVVGDAQVVPDEPPAAQEPPPPAQEPPPAQGPAPTMTQGQPYGQAPADPSAAAHAVSSMLAAQEAQAPAPREPVQTTISEPPTEPVPAPASAPAPAAGAPEVVEPGETVDDIPPAPRPHPEADPTAVEPEAPLEPTPSVPGASVDELRADLAYWHDVLADEEYRTQQGLSEEEVQANVAELTSAIDALEAS